MTTERIWMVIRTKAESMSADALTLGTSRRKTAMRNVECRSARGDRPLLGGTRPNRSNAYQLD